MAAGIIQFKTGNCFHERWLISNSSPKFRMSWKVLLIIRFIVSFYAWFKAKPLYGPKNYLKGHFFPETVSKKLYNRANDPWNFRNFRKFLPSWKRPLCTEPLAVGGWGRPGTGIQIVTISSQRPFPTATPPFSHLKCPARITTHASRKWARQGVTA